MSEMKGKGLPTRKTQGSIGDIYIDTNTGKKYRCKFSYGLDKDCEWQPIETDILEETVKEVIEEVTPEPVEEPKVAPVKEVVETAVKEPPKQERPNKKNYQQYGKNFK